MKWTFGIVTAGGQEDRIMLMIESIEKQNIPINDYEIIIVGNCKIQRNNLKNLDFNENIKPGWITRKKNMISQVSFFNNVCLMHDYIILLDDWYKNFVNFGEDWDVCMNRIERMDGKRYRDWTLWMPDNIPYEDHSRIKDMYVSGAYFCAKKQFLLQYPFDENRVWGRGEDLEWSMRVRGHWNYKCNSNSIVRLLKKPVCTTGCHD
jgi:hypothetical protein